MRYPISIIVLLIFASATMCHSLPTKSQVFILKTTDRAMGAKTLLNQFDLSIFNGKKIIIKPNYNSDDPFPATTHIDTLKTVIQVLKTVTPESMVIAERSGMGNTKKVLENRGVYALTSAEGIAVINLDELKKEEWTIVGTQETHWNKGFPVPNIVLEADYIINLPCLKTHRFGGDFTMALKNNVGLVAKWHGAYNYMWELHSSSDQRRMIAEINKYLPQQLIIMDGIKGFSTQGPEQGNLIKPGIMMISTDPVAIDAVGVAILRIYGTTERVEAGKIFDQEQLNRAAELNIGAASPEDIELVPLDDNTKTLTQKIETILYAQ